MEGSLPLIFKSYLPSLRSLWCRAPLRIVMSLGGTYCHFPSPSPYPESQSQLVHSGTRPQAQCLENLQQPHLDSFKKKVFCKPLIVMQVSVQPEVPGKTVFSVSQMKNK